MSRKCEWLEYAPEAEIYYEQEKQQGTKHKLYEAQSQRLPAEVVAEAQINFELDPP